MMIAREIVDGLVVKTTPLAHGTRPDSDDLISLLPEADVAAWVRQGEGLIGWGEAARLVLHGDDRFDRARQWLADVFGSFTVEDELGLPGSGPIAFGSFSFDPGSDSILIIPKVVFGQRNGIRWRTTVGESGNDRPPPLAANPPAKIRWSDGDVDPSRHLQAVRAAVERIRTGMPSKVVLARDLLAVAGSAIDQRIPLRRLARRFPSCYTFVCAGLIGATPELLVRRTGNDVESLVLAGTSVESQDSSAGLRLLASVKDREEHTYAAEMVRATLSSFCAELTAPEEPELLALSNLTHLATPVRGQLRDNRSVLDLVAALHPTPAVAGYPTEAALDLIRELETMERGRYAGPVGWVDAQGDGEWGIALRCAQIDGRQARLYAGGGIVAASDPVTELAETDAKFLPMRHALQD